MPPHLPTQFRQSPTHRGQSLVSPGVNPNQLGALRPSPSLHICYSVRLREWRLKEESLASGSDRLLFQSQRCHLAAA